MSSQKPPPQAADSEGTQQRRYVLGVDGGGTKTAARLATFSEEHGIQVIGDGMGGSSNARAVGTEVAEDNLHRAIDCAWRQSGHTPRPVDRAVFALAGSGIAEIRRHFELWAETQGIAWQASVVHDAEAVLAAATSEQVGAALICGTGSVALAQRDESKRALAGGWGFWFGDEGSGYWIGQQALRAVSKAFDGRGPQTALTARILQCLSTDDPRAMIAILSRDDMRSAIAGLAEFVTAAADEGDSVANEIVNQAVGELVSLVEAVLRKTGLASGFTLALAGGVLVGSASLRDKLCAQLKSSGFSPAKVELVPEPVLGCLRLAVRGLRGESRKEEGER